VKRFLLISDIHATDIDPSASRAPSYVSSFRSAAGKRIDPLGELEFLIKREGLAPDCVLCPGDITNKSQTAPFSYAWQRLQDLATNCGAKLVATVGNHDVDSRYYGNSFDPRGFAMSLSPTLPTGDRQQFLEFWAENFTLVSGNDCNIVALNTAAYHGSGRDIAREIEHGRVSDSTLASLARTLDSVPSASVNILLCHHHLIRPESSDQEFVGQTRGGEKLVQLLSERDESWIVVHGHKHVPDLFYGPGGSNAPVILACASFSAQINEDAQNKNPNQVHFLVCDPASAKANGLMSCGTIYSWTWQPGVGWSESIGLLGLPHEVGFGHRASVDPLADSVVSFLSNSGSSASEWSTAAAHVPGLIQLIPADFKRFEKAVERRGLVILRDRGRLAQIGRRP
jgi:predicted phosphodiesterase